MPKQKSKLLWTRKYFKAGRRRWLESSDEEDGLESSVEENGVSVRVCSSDLGRRSMPMCSLYRLFDNKIRVKRIETLDFFENIFFCVRMLSSTRKKMFNMCNESLIGLIELLFIIALTLKGSCVQTLVQTKKASHFEVDLETKQKKGHHLAKRNSCETANHLCANKESFSFRSGLGNKTKRKVTILPETEFV